MGKWMTIDNKRALIRQSHEAPGMTQTQLAEWAQQAFRLAKAPARNTVSDILKNGEIIMKGEYGKGKRRNPLKVKAPALEKQLDEWVTRAEKCGMCLNRKVILEFLYELIGFIKGPEHMASEVRVQSVLFRKSDYSKRSPFQYCCNLIS
ncbi:hypothetical protein L917_13525 [Phytophthora nicotianae]|uniref:HTH CENPB-type domain-containing protein n=1 Tax=Phytophthora nicotianae TaxID=4792 RepID=W2KQ75_PHYNI|nr:hypothetical protein L917_13525 [Phytophthora nicotianae]